MRFTTQRLKQKTTGDPFSPGLLRGLWRRVRDLNPRWFSEDHARFRDECDKPDSANPPIVRYGTAIS